MPNNEALQQAMSQELAGAQQSQFSGPGWRKNLSKQYPHIKKLKPVDRRRLFSALETADYNGYSNMRDRLLQPDGAQYAQGLIGVDGEVFKSMEQGLAMQRKDQATQLQERAPTQAPDLSDFDL